MADDSRRWAAISARPMFGTATPVQVLSVLPADKRERERFWVDVLIQRMDELRARTPRVLLAVDDSDGQHDVLIMLDGTDAIGAQVTELTSEIQRRLSAQQQGYVKDVLNAIESRGLRADRGLAVKCFFPVSSRGHFTPVDPHEIVDRIDEFIAASTDRTVKGVSGGTLVLNRVDSGQLYMPSIGNIGFDCAVDEIPRDLEMYVTAVSLIREKKSHSRSPWLLIWSSSFWKDKHLLGDDVVRNLRESFQDSHFQRVFFVESMDGEGVFQANLGIHRVKG